MYLAIDVGGTKTLLAVFSISGEMLEKHQFPTRSSYKNWLEDLEAELGKLKSYKISACCCSLPGIIDRKRGIGIVFGNLKWHNVPLRQDLNNLLDISSIYIENDGNLAGVHEATFFADKYKKILYLSVGTGIGDAMIVDGKLDEDFLDGEGGQMVLSHDGKLEKWEDFASGRAITERFGKKAAEIDDPKIWQIYASGLAQGIAAEVAPFKPEIVIIGGGIGTHFAKYGKFLNDELKKYANKMVAMPQVIQADKPEEAVVYGCYDYIHQQIG